MCCDAIIISSTEYRNGKIKRSLPPRKGKLRAGKKKLLMQSASAWQAASVRVRENAQGRGSSSKTLSRGGAGQSSYESHVIAKSWPKMPRMCSKPTAIGIPISFEKRDFASTERQIVAVVVIWVRTHNLTAKRSSNGLSPMQATRNPNY